MKSYKYFLAESHSDIIKLKEHFNLDINYEYLLLYTHFPFLFWIDGNILDWSSFNLKTKTIKNESIKIEKYITVKNYFRNLKLEKINKN